MVRKFWRRAEPCGLERERESGGLRQGGTVNVANGIERSYQRTLNFRQAKVTHELNLKTPYLNAPQSLSDPVHREREGSEREELLVQSETAAADG